MSYLQMNTCSIVHFRGPEKCELVALAIDNEGIRCDWELAMHETRCQLQPREMEMHSLQKDSIVLQVDF